MLCETCKQEIIKTHGAWQHAETLTVYCYPRDSIAEPMLKPNAWCTGQKWIDNGGSWDEFVKAHKADKDAEFLYYVGSSAQWMKAKDHLYNSSPERYRLKLDKNAQLLRAREVPLIDPTYFSRDMWGAAMDWTGFWHRYTETPVRNDDGQGWMGKHLRLPKEAYPKNWKGSWRDSAFTKEEIIQRWEEENANNNLP